MISFANLKSNVINVFLILFMVMAGVFYATPSKAMPIDPNRETCMIGCAVAYASCRNLVSFDCRYEGPICVELGYESCAISYAACQGGCL